MWPDDMESIFNACNDLNTEFFDSGSRPFVFLEVIDYNQQGEVPLLTNFLFFDSCTCISLELYMYTSTCMYSCTCTFTGFVRFKGERARVHTHRSCHRVPLLHQSWKRSQCALADPRDLRSRFASARLLMHVHVCNIMACNLQCAGVLLQAGACALRKTRSRLLITMTTNGDMEAAMRQ